jgi:hypothetical protein
MLLAPGRRTPNAERRTVNAPLADKGKQTVYHTRVATICRFPKRPMWAADASVMT